MVVSPRKLKPRAWRRLPPVPRAEPMPPGAAHVLQLGVGLGGWDERAVDEALRQVENGRLLLVDDGFYG